MSEYRIERDTMGEVRVQAHHLWGAQTQRFLDNFPFPAAGMPPGIVRGQVLVKQAAATVNMRLCQLEAAKADAIRRAADEVLAGGFAGDFPLDAWQTGSGTHVNMNVNEVLANRASELLGGQAGAASLVHPIDDVNRGQSSNDAFPTAMHVAAALALYRELLPALIRLRATLEEKSRAFMPIVKIGRTHLQDATPLTLGQEFSGYVAQLDLNVRTISAALPPLYELAMGGTAVGTGLNAHPDFGAGVAGELTAMTGLPFVTAGNKFQALATCDALVAAHGALKSAAASLTKIANDIRWLASGPRCAIGEISIPENEPGSSIMPGKVNPSQCESLAMVCCQVIANDVAISLAGSSGNFEINTYRPLIIRCFLQSAELLAHACRNFADRCVSGITPNRERIDAFVRESLMLVTALNPHIGYDRAAAIAKKAHLEGSTLREAAVASGHVTADQFDVWVRPERMVGIVASDCGAP